MPAFDLVTLCRTTDNIRVAASRAAKIVSALKRLAHPGDAAGAPTGGSISESLDTVLTLYQSQIKQGIEVERAYEAPGVVWARHDQLNQVWTNLVHNALQAMGETGTLALSVRELDGHVEVAITDSGPGIPVEAQKRVFEPFFTTKPLGEGTGLGLSICWDIVTQHGGTLAFETAPGRTTFTVTLPTAH